MTREEIARRMFERVNGTNPDVPWAPGGWDAANQPHGSDSTIMIIYWQCADVALELLENQRASK